MHIVFAILAPQMALDQVISGTLAATSNLKMKILSWGVGFRFIKRRKVQSLLKEKYNI